MKLLLFLLSQIRFKIQEWQICTVWEEFFSVYKKKFFFDGSAIVFIESFF